MPDGRRQWPTTTVPPGSNPVHQGPPSAPASPPPPQQPPPHGPTTYGPPTYGPRTPQPPGAQQQAAEPPTTDPTDWELAEQFLRRHPTRWGSLSWIAARPLIASVNHVLARGAGSLVADLRSHYVAQTTVPGLVLDRRDVTGFVLIGDTGEADGSQYVVAPALSRVVRATRPGFVLVMSDVIYPSGDVNDYVDGLYHPYRSPEDDRFHVDAPLLGQPGNHDWYGSLFGFMYHFCRVDQPPPPELWAPTTGSIGERLARILWRRPSSPAAATRSARDATPPTLPELPQPGPYGAVRLHDVTVVSIDTGIEGTLDPQQMAWLVAVSRNDPAPKVLVTGSPLLVDAERHRCPVEPPTPGLPSDVWEVVTHPDHHYVATVGGDVHNLQRYTLSGSGSGSGSGGGAGSGTGAAGPLPTVPQVHLVAGHGGAFMHATHPIDLAVTDARTDLSDEHPYPDLLFPTPQESFAFFARQLVPSVWRIMRAALCFVAGVAVVPGLLGLTVAAEHWSLPGAGVLGALAAGLPAAVLLGAAAVLIVVGAVRLVVRGQHRSSRVKRLLVPVGAGACGLAATGLAYVLDPSGFWADLGLWSASTAWTVLVAWAIRRTGWWLPEQDHPAEREVGSVPFVAGLLVLAGLCTTAQLLAFTGAAPRIVAVLCGAAVLVVGLVGRVVRRRPGAARWWRRRGATVAVGLQLVVVAAALGQHAAAADRVRLYGGALLGVVLLGVLVAVTAAALVLLTAVAALPGQLLGGTAGWRRAWGRAAGVVHHLPIPLLLTGAAGWVLTVDAVDTSDAVLLRAALGLPAVVVALVAALLLSDLLRRFLRRTYVLVLVAVCAAVGTVAWWWDGWPVRVTAAALVVTAAVVASALIAHLVFLGAHTLLSDRGARTGDITFTPEQLAEIFAAKTGADSPPGPGGRRRPRVPRLPHPVDRWAQLAYPGIGEPGGPLQRQVAEIYSRDLPPFFKGFLHLESSAQELVITGHRVFGDRRADSEILARVRLR